MFWKLTILKNYKKGVMIMTIKMAGLSPHPPLIIPEIGGDEVWKVQDTIDSLKELAEEIKESDPNILITVSPHGSVFRDAISVLDLDRLYGNFSEFGAPEVEIEVESLPYFIDELEKQARESNLEIIRLNQDKKHRFNVSTELDHGVMVPLYYIKKAGLDNIPVVALTMGLLDYNSLYRFGGLIDKTLDQCDKDAVILASGDLSHRLKPGAPAGFNPRGKEFDEKLVQLLKDEEFPKILNIDQKLIEKAGECGLRPLIITLAALQEYDVNNDVMSYEGPFGVGYAVAGLHPSKNR